MTKKTYFHIPGFFEFFKLNKKLIKLMELHHDYFYDNYRIGSVYGSFPNAIWNGGRVCFGLCFKEDMEECIKFYNDYNIPIRHTFTNSLIEDTHLNDTYCNLILDVSNNGLNQILVNSDILENYIRNKYPNFKLVSSTTKRITDIDKLNEELDKDYFLVVLDYDLNKKWNYLSQIDNKDRIEILLDELCDDRCPYRKEHYKFYSDAQINFRRNNFYKCKFIEKQVTEFNQLINNNNFISNNEINKYIEIGFNNFKLVGRGTDINIVIDSYVYYLVKPEYKNLVKVELIKGTVEE